MSIAKTAIINEQIIVTAIKAFTLFLLSTVFLTTKYIEYTKKYFNINSTVPWKVL